MTKIETITPKELKKIMKLSIAIDVELSFYLACHLKTLTIDKGNDWDTNKIAMYNINDEDHHAIFILINAYAKVHTRHINIQ